MQLRLEVTIFPAIENTRSDLEDVAGIPKYISADFASQSSALTFVRFPP
jgi:hypothetical protein